RGRVARLRMPRHAAQFDEAKPQRLPHWRRLGVLVHSGGKSQWIWKFQTEQFDRQCRRAVKRSQRVQEDIALRDPAQGLQSAIVNRLRILSKKRRPDEIPVKPSHGGRMSSL